MKEKLNVRLVRLSLSFVFSVLMLVMLLCGLSQATEAERGGSFRVTSREREPFRLLNGQTGVSICQQADNRVYNPGFEQGNGVPSGWHEDGPCSFQYDDPGPDSDVSAEISVGPPPSGEYCRLRTVPIDRIDVEAGRFYDYSAWVQGDLEQGEASLRVVFYKRQGGDWQSVKIAYTESVTDTDEGWVKVTGSAQAPADAEYATVEAFLPESSQGRVRFDDVFLGLATCLEISKSDGPDPVEPEQMLFYAVTYTNTGREKATDVRVLEDYDDNVDFVKAEPPPDRGDDYWEIGELSPGVSDTIMITVLVEDHEEMPKLLVNTVEILSKEVEQSAIATTEVVSPDLPCDFFVALLDAEKLGKPGYWTDYNLDLINTGSYDGEVNLEATSSNGWDVEITPTSTFTLHVNDTEPVTVSVEVPEYASGGMTDPISITATFACTSSQIVSRTRTVTTTVEPNPNEWFIYFPLLRSHLPLAAPELYAIEDGYGSYTVCWSTVEDASSYVLEEDTDGTFAAPSSIYAGTDTCYPVNGRGAARYYYYRVKARNSWVDSRWSNVQSIDVLWEKEPNDDALTQANGPIICGPVYHGTLEGTDPKDYFYFELSTSKNVEVWLTDIPQGCDYDLVLRDADLELVDYSDKFDSAGEHIPYYEPWPLTLLPGRYYIQIYPYKGGCSAPYDMWVECE
jgi:hypothetical protein